MNQATSRAKGNSEITITTLLLGPLLLASACVPGANPPPSVTDPGPGPGFGSGGSFGGPQPVFESPITAAVPPPAITGGTLLALADGRTAVAADPDRDKIFVVDYKAANVLATIGLNAGDEPGRATQDADGRVHVALRRGGAIVTLTPGTWQVAARRAICAAPRGLTFDARTNNVLVACADGDLVSLPAAPDGAAISRRHLDRDLRDVVIAGGNTYVSRFRSAEVFVIDSSDQLTRITPQPRQTFQSNAVFDSSGNLISTNSMVSMNAAVAWRMAPTPDGEVLVMHQRGADRPVSTTPGGYGGFSCGGIVETTVSRVHPTDSVQVSPALDQVTLAVDMAISPDGQTVVLAAPGNYRQERNGSSQLLAFDRSAVSGHSGMRPDCQPPQIGVPKHHDADQGSGGAGGATTSATTMTSRGSGGFNGNVAIDDARVPFPMPGGEVTAVAFDATGLLLVQTREPATLQIINGPGTKVTLSTESRLDTGHAIFHANSGASLACASCHPEGGDDGRVWIFAEKGRAEPRRTQNLRGGVLATAPFHWDGTLPDVNKLMTEVFVGRMSGPVLTDQQVGALSHWVDGIPLLPALPTSDQAAVDRGSALFKSSGCATCHAGALLTDNKTQNVGTGLPVQTPSLRGVAWRAPYMHTGCAKTLTDRFSASCGGGDSHGAVSALDDAKRADLITYLETL